LVICAKAVREGSADGVSARGFSIREGMRTKRKQKRCQANELMVGDCWIGLTQAQGSGLILATRVGKHTDEFISNLGSANQYIVVFLGILFIELMVRIWE
jgi:hypothetical protein